MKPPFLEPLQCIPRSKAIMLVHPSWTLGLVALAALLSAGASLLAGHFGLPDQLQPDDINGMFKRSLLNMAVLFPLELYFLPRWVLATDAGLPDALFPKDGRNTEGDWRQSFEERWVRVFLARLMVAAAASMGFFLCIAPGILVLVFFGWTPWRVLLYGEPILIAAKASAKRMAMLWPQVLTAAATILLTAILFNGLVASATAHIGGHLGWHVSNAVAQVSMVWMNAALLGLYLWMEAEAQARGQGPGVGG